MAEINNNIPSFGYKKIEKIDKPEQIEKPIEQENKQEQQTYAPDPGVLGRSQVRLRPAKGANIEKTIEETVALAENNPALMGCCEGVFDTVYDDLIAQGKNPDDAYMQALFAEQELLEICPHN